MKENAHLIALRGNKSVPPTLTVEVAAELFGMSRASAYRAVAASLNGEPGIWPTRIICVGSRRMVPTIDVLGELGLTELFGPGLLESVAVTLARLDDEAGDLSERKAG